MSDLLNKASLVMVPSGYKEDTVYSVVPSDGSGDLSFTRASNGTRVNSAGLVEVCPWNLVLYSEDFSNGFWTTTSTTITADNTTAPNGTATADKVEISSSSNARVQQIINSNLITGGLPCTFSVYIKSVSGTGNVGIRSGQTGLSSVFSYTNQWQRFEWTFNAYALSEIMQFCNNTLVGGADSAPTFYAWGAQLNIGSTAKPYFPTTDRLNVPRLTYQNGGGGCPSLLLEKQSTNVVTYSEQFDNGAWVKSGSNSVTANAIISPDGTQNADFVVSTATNSSPKYVYQVISSIATPTATIYAKAGAVTEMMFYCQGGNGIYFNLTNGAFVAYYSGGASTITSYSSVAVGNGWYRYSITFNTSVTSIEAYMASGGSISPSIANGDGFYLWGAQLEASSYATSYIPTTSSSATRVADACFKTGISSLIGQTEGTVFVDLNFNGEIFGLTNNYYIYIGNGLNTNAIYIDQYNNSFRWVVFDGTTLRFYTDVAMTTGRHKLALAYKNNDYSAYLDGTLITTQTLVSGAVPTCSQFSLIGNVSNFDNNVKQINQAVLFKTRLTNSELASLTTI